jgi:hypothetical protein
MKLAGMDKPDYLCYMAYIQMVLLRAHKLHPDATTVNLVFAEKQETKKDMKRIVEAMRHLIKAEAPEVSALFGECTFAAPEREIGLQAADLISWHLQRNYTGKFSRSDEDRMYYLLKERDGDLHEWPKDLLQEFADQIAAYTALKSGQQKASKQ